MERSWNHATEPRRTLIPRGLVGVDWPRSWREEGQSTGIPMSGALGKVGT